MYRILYLFCLISLNCAAQRVVLSQDPLLYYSGRLQHNANPVRMEWPGTSVKIRFTGANLSVDMKDEHGKNRFNVLIDGKVVDILSPDSVRQEYVLAKGLGLGEHTAELFKRTEAGSGGT